MSRSSLKSINFFVQKRRIEQMLEKQQEKLRHRLDNRNIALMPKISQYLTENEDLKVKNQSQTHEGSILSEEESFLDSLNTINPICKSMCTKTSRPETPLPIDDDENPIQFINNSRRYTDFNYKYNSNDNYGFVPINLLNSPYKDDINILDTHDFNGEIDNINRSSSNDLLFDAQSCSIMTCPQDLDDIPPTFSSWLCCELSNENRCFLIYEELCYGDIPSLTKSELLYPRIISDHNIIGEKNIESEKQYYNTDIRNNILDDNIFCINVKKVKLDKNKCILENNNVNDYTGYGNDHCMELLAGNYKGKINYIDNQINQLGEEVSVSNDMEISLSEEVFDEKKGISTSKIALRPFGLVLSRESLENDENDQYSIHSSNMDNTQSHSYLPDENDIDICNNNKDNNKTIKTSFKIIDDDIYEKIPDGNDDNGGSNDSFIMPKFCSRGIYTSSGGTKTRDSKISNSGMFRPHLTKSKSDISLGLNYPKPCAKANVPINQRKRTNSINNYDRIHAFATMVNEDKIRGIKYRNISISTNETSLPKRVLIKKFNNNNNNSYDNCIEGFDNYDKSKGKTENIDINSNDRVTRTVARIMYPDETLSPYYEVLPIPGVKRAIFDGVLDEVTNEFTAIDLLKLEYIDDNNDKNRNVKTNNINIGNPKFRSRNEKRNFTSCGTSTTNALFNSEKNFDYSNTSALDGATAIPPKNISETYCLENMNSTDYTFTDMTWSKECGIKTLYASNFNMEESLQEDDFNHRRYLDQSSKIDMELNSLFRNFDGRCSGENTLLPDDEVLLNHSASNTYNNNYNYGNEIEALCGKPYIFRLKMLTKIINSKYIGSYHPCISPSDGDDITGDRYMLEPYLQNEETSYRSPSVISRSSAFRSIRIENELDLMENKFGDRPLSFADRVVQNGINNPIYSTIDWDVDKKTETSVKTFEKRNSNVRPHGDTILNASSQKIIDTNCYLRYNTKNTLQIIPSRTLTPYDNIDNKGAMENVENYSIDDKYVYRERNNRELFISTAETSGGESQNTNFHNMGDNGNISYDTECSQISAFRNGSVAQKRVNFDKNYSSEDKVLNMKNDFLPSKLCIKIKLPVTYSVDSMNFRILMDRIAEFDTNNLVENNELVDEINPLPVIYFYDPNASYKPGLNKHILRWKFRK